MSRAELDDERTFLLASLEDLERERAAGDVSLSDYQELRDRYTRRAAEVLRALEDGGRGHNGDGVAVAVPVPSGHGAEADGGRRSARLRRLWARRPRRRRPVAVMGVVLMAVAVTAFVALRHTSTQLPGEPITGSVHLTPAEQEQQTLSEAEAEETSGDAPEAVALYQQVLVRDPTQVEALANVGWLEFEAGVAAQNATLLTEAQRLEQRAVAARPGAYAPHLYLGSMLLTENEAAAAVTQYRLFLGDRPPVTTVRAAERFMARAFAQAHQPLPALPGPAGASPSTSAAGGGG